MIAEMLHHGASAWLVFLADAAVKGALLLAGAGVVAAGMRRKSAAARQMDPRRKRRKLTRLSTVAAAMLAVAVAVPLSILQAAPDSPPRNSDAEASKEGLDARIAGLVDRLGSASFAEREEAQEELLKIGLPALTALEEAAGDKNSERASRAGKIMQKIVQDAFQARLGDVTVRLLGVGSARGGANAWWLPNGHPWPRPGELRRWTEDGRKGQRVFWVEVRGLDPKARTHVRIAPAEAAQSGGGSRKDGGRLVLYGRTSVPPGVRTVAVDVGIENGPWREVASAKPGQQVSLPDGEEVVFSAIQREDGAWKLTCRYPGQNKADMRYQVALIKADGKPIYPESSGHLQAGDRSVEATCRFTHLDPQAVSEGRLEARAVKWIRFGNVSVARGRITQVQTGRIPGRQAGRVSLPDGVSAVKRGALDGERAAAARAAERCLRAAQQKNWDRAEAQCLGSAAGWMSRQDAADLPAEPLVGLARDLVRRAGKEIAQDISFPGDEVRAGKPALSREFAGVPFRTDSQGRYLLVLLKRTRQGWRVVTFDDALGTVAGETAALAGRVRKHLERFAPRPATQPASTRPNSSQPRELFRQSMADASLDQDAARRALHGISKVRAVFRKELPADHEGGPTPGFDTFYVMIDGKEYHRKYVVLTGGGKDGPPRAWLDRLTKVREQGYALARATLLRPDDVRRERARLGKPADPHGIREFARGFWKAARSTGAGASGVSTPKTRRPADVKLIPAKPFRAAKLDAVYADDRMALLLAEAVEFPAGSGKREAFFVELRRDARRSEWRHSGSGPFPEAQRTQRIEVFLARRPEATLVIGALPAPTTRMGGEDKTPRPAPVAAVRTWDALLEKKPIDLGGGVRAYVGIESKTVPVDGGVLVYCITEGWRRPETWAPGGLGPLRMHVRRAGSDRAAWCGKPPGLRAAGALDLTECRALFARAVTADRPGKLTVTLSAPDGTPAARTVVTAKKMKGCHPWTPWRKAQSRRSEDQEQDAPDAVPAFNVENRARGIAIPNWNGGGAGLVTWQGKCELGEREPLKRLPRCVPQSVRGDGPLRAEFQDGVIRISSSQPFLTARPDHHFLTRWWVNGEPVIPEQIRSFPGDVDGLIVRGKRLDLRLHFVPGRIGAEKGDKVRLQLLYLRDGWHWAIPRIEQLAHMPARDLPARIAACKPIEFVVGGKTRPSSSP